MMCIFAKMTEKTVSVYPWCCLEPTCLSNTLSVCVSSEKKCVKDLQKPVKRGGNGCAAVLTLG